MSKLSPKISDISQDRVTSSEAPSMDRLQIQLPESMNHVAMSWMVLYLSPGTLGPPPSEGETPG